MSAITTGVRKCVVFDEPGTRGLRRQRHGLGYLSRRGAIPRAIVSSAAARRSSRARSGDEGAEYRAVRAVAEPYACEPSRRREVGTEERTLAGVRDLDTGNARFDGRGVGHSAGTPCGSGRHAEPQLHEQRRQAVRGPTQVRGIGDRRYAGGTRRLRRGEPRTGRRKGSTGAGGSRVGPGRESLRARKDSEVQEPETRG